MKANYPLLVVILVLNFLFAIVCKSEVLIVADEFPAMEFLAKYLKTNANIDCKIISQSQFDTNLEKYNAIIVYIHRNLEEKVEKSLIDYTVKGGKLIPLHHSISSGKRKNKYWFDFLGITLPEGDLEKGGYKWIEDVEIEIVNLIPEHFITSTEIKYPDKIVFNDLRGEKTLPSFKLTESEVYLNHKLSGEHTLLLGFKYTDEKNKKTYMQHHCGWIKKAGNGLVIYLMPGHSIKDFQNEIYSRIVLNAILYKP